MNSKEMATLKPKEKVITHNSNRMVSQHTDLTDLNSQYESASHILAEFQNQFNSGQVDMNLLKTQTKMNRLIGQQQKKKKEIKEEDKAPIHLQKLEFPSAAPPTSSRQSVNQASIDNS